MQGWKQGWNGGNGIAILQQKGLHSIPVECLEPNFAHILRFTCFRSRTRSARIPRAQSLSFRRTAKLSYSG